MPHSQMSQVDAACGIAVLLSTTILAKYSSGYSSWDIFWKHDSMTSQSINHNEYSIQ